MCGCDHGASLRLLLLAGLFYTPAVGSGAVVCSCQWSAEAAPLLGV